MAQKTVAEMISAFEAKRAASTARLADIMSKAADDGRTLDETETEEYEALKLEIKAVDEHIVRLKEQETIMIQKAVAVTKVDDPARAAAVRSGEPIVMKTNVPKGMAFTRYVKALAMARGSLTGALAIAENNKSWMDSTPQVAAVLKAAVAAGDTTTSGWASELVYNQNLANEFIDLLRPQTILGKLTGLTHVPFNVRMAGQDSGSSAYWVGQAKPVPVSKLDTLEVTLGIAKAAGLVILTDELVRSSSPAAEMLVQNDLTKSIATFLDVQFIAPDYAAVSNVSPASITNGVAPTAATGTDSTHLRTDLQTLLKTFVAANYDPTGLVLIMTPGQALACSLMLNALGNPVFPNINMNGGNLLGIPVVCSNSAVQVGSPVTGEGQLIVLASAPDILMADDGQVTIDASREASIEMLDGSLVQDGHAGTGTSLVSMFQTNSIAIRAVRFINWKKRRSTAVAYIKDAAYVS